MYVCDSKEILWVLIEQSKKHQYIAGTRKCVYDATLLAASH
jgi:hypothetical protein